jgi:hypothetical protein
MPAALPELAAEAGILLLLLLVLELARGVCCGEHSLTTGNPYQKVARSNHVGITNCGMSYVYI